MGIDIRAGAIARCRERLPSVNFQVSSIEEFSGGPYDVVTSVTVLQHIRDQRKAAESIFKLLKPGGSMVMLENIKFRSETCFGNSIQKWVEIMEGSGFEVERILAYDYSPWLKLRFPSFILKWLMPWGLRVEEFLITQQPQYLKSQHCGFLFRKPI
jgi:ubiquinone/menaquinone biosynthesis C-methylase UbiE